MKDNDLVDKLAAHNIRPTAVRLLIAKTIKSSDNPLSSLEIEKILDTVDRSTITRSISLFHEKGILHAIDDGSGSTRFEWCNTDDEIEDSDLHVHFHCNKCGKTLCLHSIPIPEIKLPDGFSPESTNFTVTGICNDCNKKK